MAAFLSLSRARSLSLSLFLSLSLSFSVCLSVCLCPSLSLSLPLSLYLSLPLPSTRRICALSLSLSLPFPRSAFTAHTPHLHLRTHTPCPRCSPWRPKGTHHEAGRFPAAAAGRFPAASRSRIFSARTTSTTITATNTEAAAGPRFMGEGVGQTCLSNVLESPSTFYLSQNTWTWLRKKTRL